MEGAEGNIVGAALAGLHGEMPAGMAGRADDRIWPKDTPRFLDRRIALAHMHAVRAQLEAQIWPVVDDEGNAARLCDRGQRGARAQHGIISDPLEPQLEAGDVTRVKRARQDLGKAGRIIEARRRDQIEPARRAFGQGDTFVWRS
jgi:hypothetical protein